LTQKPELDELLDAWEDRSESEADLSATQFIRSLGDQVDSGLIEDFLHKAAELAAFQKKADRLVFVDDSQATSLSSKPSRNGLELGERRWLTQGAEPTDGYRLISKLGRGGFGEA